MFNVFLAINVSIWKEREETDKLRSQVVLAMQNLYESVMNDFFTTELRCEDFPLLCMKFV